MSKPYYMGKKEKLPEMAANSYPCLESQNAQQKKPGPDARYKYRPFAVLLADD